MKISGFSMVKNATKLYYPIKQAIQSVLPIVDEFVIAIGDCDKDDNTRDEVLSIGSDKVKIIDTVWDIEKFKRGSENAHQTDIAKEACSGDWLLYLQADEVIHERYLDNIVKSCKQYLDYPKVEGLLFKYKHFWGDYRHYHISHGWYPYEIRIVRNDPDIHSWQSAQSFRRIPNFDGFHYHQEKGTSLLNVALIDAYIYHYGWVRPPKLMRNKMKSLETIHHGKEKVDAKFEKVASEFDYGPLELLGEFKESHPKVMEDWIKKFDWSDKLYQSGTLNPYREKHKHEKFKYRLLTFLEQTFFGGHQIGYFKNYKRIY